MLYTFDSGALLAVQHLTDEELMRAITRKDQRAFNELHRRHSAALCSVVNRIVHDEFASEDVVQEIFIDLWESAGRYSETKGKVAGWLTTISRRRAIDRLRKIQCRQRAHDRLESDLEKQPTAWTHTRIESDIEASELQRILAGMIERLPKAQRDAVHWAYYDGMSQREIAAQMQIPLGTIKTRLDLAIRKLSGAVREVLNDATAVPATV